MASLLVVIPSMEFLNWLYHHTSNRTIVGCIYDAVIDNYIQLAFLVQLIFELSRSDCRCTLTTGVGVIEDSVHSQQLIVIIYLTVLIVNSK